MSTKNPAIKAAYDLGKYFAEYLNHNPDEAQNWRKLERDDEIHEYDYELLSDIYGWMTREIEQAYKDGFNETFIPIGYEEEDEEEE